MAYSESLAERVRQALAGRKQLVEKKMFGGVGFLLRGNMLVGVWKTFLIARIGKEASEKVLQESHVRVFDITGKAMTGWVMVEPEGLQDADQLEVWLARATKFVRTLPEK